MKNLLEEKINSQLVQNPSIESRFRLRQGRDGMTTGNQLKKKIIRNKEKGIQKIRFHRADLVCTSLHLDWS